MSPLPLRCRILGALELQAMSAPQLARCLCARTTYIQRLLAELRKLGVVRSAGAQRTGNWRPERKFEVRA